MAKARRSAGATEKSVSVDEIVDAAIRIADAEGLESVTMRRLAAEVSLGTMTLYSYFDSKDRLLDGIADALLGRFVTPEASSDPVAFFVELTRGLFDIMQCHLSVVHLFVTRTTTTHDSMQSALEQPIGRLVEVGFAPEDAVRLYGLAITYALGFSVYRIPRPWGADPDHNENVAEERRQRAVLYQSLPLHRFPTMVELNEPLSLLPTRDQFEWGLSLLAAGVGATVKPVPARSRKRTQATTATS